MQDVDYVKLGKQVRRTIVEMVAEANRGHLASAFSLIEILNVLYESVLSLKVGEPKWEDRDRLILSKGHGCLALYPILARKRYFPEAELMRFCREDGILGGHPDHRKVPGVETSTGALGHGLSVGIGMALAAKLNKSPARVFVILGDGECDEGSIWEGALSASKHRLDRLTVLVDYNKMQSYASTKEVLDLEPFADKWRSFGFEVREADMESALPLHDLLQSLPFQKGKPSVVICHTTKGKGVSFMENSAEWHHKSKITPEELGRLMQELKD